MPPKVRPAGSGRKVRAKRRREELAAGGRLLSAVAYHGHTASGRLRLLNTFLQIFWAKELFSSQITGVLEAPDEEWKDVNPLVVDVGFGEEPTTTRELRGLLREGVNVVATEADEARLEAARASQTDASGIRRDIRFCYTGTTFDLPQSQVMSNLVCLYGSCGYSMHVSQPVS